MMPTRHHPRTLLAAVLGALLGFVPLGRMANETAGDDQLIADTRKHLGGTGGYASISMARITPTGTSFAGFGSVRGEAPTPDSAYELGSITKTWTGMLLAIAIERGEMALDDPLEKHLPELLGTPAGSVTLEELATHTSGLPRLPRSVMLASLPRIIGNDDPYASWTTDAIIAATKGETLGAKSHTYSNLGISLLGHAEARAAGVSDWETLATDRLLTPLQMRSTVFMSTPANLAPATASNGWHRPFWTGRGFAPSGSGTRTTAHDLAQFAAAVANGTAPGQAATESVMTIKPGLDIGLAWMTRVTDAGPVLWHSGGVGGGRTMLAIDPEQGTAVIGLGNSERGLDQLVVGVLKGTPAHNSHPYDPARLAGMVGIVTIVSGIMALRRGRSLLAMAGGALDIVSGLLLLAITGPWDYVTWAPMGALSAGVLVMAAGAQWRGRTLLPAAKRRSTMAGAVGSVLLFALVIWML